MAEVESTTFSWFLQEKTFFEDSKMALKFSTVLKFSTGANDSLHPKLVKAGFTPESATAILEGKPLQGFGYPGFTVSPRIYLESQWRRDNAGELAADTALPETDPDVAALNVESQPESATGACGQTGETGYRFRDRARTLFDAGFEPIPIAKKTKRPPIKEWSTVTIDAATVADWIKSHGDCGIGLRLGKDGLGAIDVDCQTEAVAQGLEEWFKVWGKNYGFTVPIRIGKAPKFLVPCRIEDIDRKSFSSEWTDGKFKNRIEILTTGNQFVAYGIHPDTGKPYTWHNAMPEMLGIERLPVISLDHIGTYLLPEFDRLCREHGLSKTEKKPSLNFIETDGLLLDASGSPATASESPAVRQRVASGTPACNPDTAGAQAPDQQAPVQDATVQEAPPRASIEELRAVLGLLPPSYCDEGYDDWLKACLALHYETQGSAAGYALFDEWSSRSVKYQGQDETWAKWKSARDDASRNVTIGTLYSWLEDSGVKLPDSLRRMRQARLEGADKPPLLADTMREAAEEQRLRAELEGADNVTDVTDVTDDTDLTVCNACYGELVTENRAQYGAVTTQLWAYIRECEGEFSNSLIYQDFSLKSAREKTAVRVTLNRLCKAGKIEKVPEKTGVYRRCDTELTEMNLDEAEGSPFPLPLPFNLSSQVKVLCGSVVVVSGTTNAGKTTFAFQCVEGFLREIVTSFRGTPHRENFRSLPLGGVENELPDFYRELAQKDKPVRYLNSEMTPGEVMARIKAMGPESVELLKNRVQWVQRTNDWARAIDPDALNVVDYLQIYDNFYQVGQQISEIHARLRHGLALVLLQKKTGEANPRGGEFALERARLAINLDSNPAIGCGGGICALRKVKVPVDYFRNPQGKELDYRLGANMRLEAVSKLRYVDKKERAQTDKRYEEERKLEERERERRQFES